MTGRPAPRQPEKNAQRDPGETGQGISSGTARRHLSYPRLQAQSVKDRSGEETALRDVSPRGQTLKTNGTDMPGGPHPSSCPNYAWGTPGISNCGGPISRFVLDTGADFSVLAEACSAFLLIRHCNGTVRTSPTLLFQSPFKLRLGLCCFSHESLIVLHSPSPLLGRNILSKVQASCFHKYGACSFSPINWTECKSWSVGWRKDCGSSKNAVPVFIKLKDACLCPHRKQCPLKPETEEGLKPIIENLKEQGLLIPCNSPCNTPILDVNKSNDKWRLVQDIWMISA